MTIAFADIVFNLIEFDRSIPSEKLVLSLIETSWMQRLRFISQTGNTRLVYMFSEHSRFGHSLGTAYLAKLVLNHLKKIEKNPEQLEKINYYTAPILAAALLHDIGHVAPGSHTAQKAWFPSAKKDFHEDTGVNIINNDPEINSILKKFSPDLPNIVSNILQKTGEAPPWCYQLVSGGGWNVDRGNWCVVDSIMAGVSYGKYNIPALIDSLVLTDKEQLALRENRIDAMMHFALSRYAMYRQVYQHRVLLAADVLNKNIIKRARAKKDSLNYADKTMSAALAASTALQLSLNHLKEMTEGWWWYHINKWSNSIDSILSDLCQRLLYRRLFKTIRILDSEDQRQLHHRLTNLLTTLGYSPEYYLNKVSLDDITTSERDFSILIQMENGEVKPLIQTDPLFKSLIEDRISISQKWFVVPEEAKLLLGRLR